MKYNFIIYTLLSRLELQYSLVNCNIWKVNNITNTANFIDCPISAIRPLTVLCQFDTISTQWFCMDFSLTFFRQEKAHDLFYVYTYSIIISIINRKYTHYQFGWLKDTINAFPSREHLEFYTMRFSFLPHPKSRLQMHLRFSEIDFPVPNLAN